MSIYPDRKNGKLTGRFKVEVQKGDQRKRGSARNYEDAQKVEARLIAELNGAAAPQAGPVTQAFSRMTVGTAAERAKQFVWAGQDTEASSLRKLDRVVEIVGADMLVDDLDNNVLDQIIVTLKAGGCSDATVNRYLSNVSKFLKFCVKRGLRTTPAPELDWRDEGEGRIRWLTYDEETAVMGLLPAPLDEVVYIAIRTGMRAMELLSIKPDQITDRWVHLWETKNDNSRSVPLSPDLHERLSRLVSEGMPDYWELRYQWDKARATMGLNTDPTFVFHACRHTFATRAVQAGVNIRVIQKLLGHKTIQTTLRYAHVDDSTLADAAFSAIDFHDKRVQSALPKRGNRGGILRGNNPFLNRGERLANQFPPRRPDGGVVTQRTANPTKTP